MNKFLVLVLMWVFGGAYAVDEMKVADANGKIFPSSALHLLSLKTMILLLAEGATTLDRSDAISPFIYKISFDTTGTSVASVVGNGSFPIIHVDTYYFGSGPNDIGQFRFLVQAMDGQSFELVKYSPELCDAIQSLLLFNVVKAPAHN